MCKSDFGHFSAFFELWTIFWPLLGNLVENSKHKKVAPGNFLNFPKKIKILTLIFVSQNSVFLKCTFSGPQSSRRGLVLIKKCCFEKGFKYIFQGLFPD